MVDWTDIIIGAIGIVFTAVLVPIGKAFFGWLKTKAESVQNEDIRKALIAASNEAENITRVVVDSLKQTVVDDIKDKREDGKLTDQEVADIAKKAWEKFCAGISAEAYYTLVEHKGDIKQYVQDLIESNVRWHKTGL